MKKWPLDKWDFIIFGAWAIIMAVGMWFYMNTGPPVDVVKFTLEPMAKDGNSI